MKNTVNYSLCYQENNLCLEGFTDADLGGDRDECKSMLGYAFLLNKGAISWSSKKQTSISLFIMEVEFVACLGVVQETIWLGIWDS